jgi:2,3-dihydroxybenzoate-AMP ligase
VFQLSGGTTGIPKLIPRTHNDYYYNSYVCQYFCGFSKNTVYLIGLPITHNYSTSSPGFQGVFMGGGTLVLAPSPAPDVILPLIERERVTMMPAVPTAVINMMSYPDLKKYDMSSLKVITIGGSKLNAEIAREVNPKLGANVQQGYGMAEGPLLLTRLEAHEEIRFHTQGGLLSSGDEIKIVDPDSGKEVPPGEVGELWWRGPTTIRGYYKAPEHNAVSFTADGFYKTGDLFRLHPSGNLVVEGRIKDTINRGGVKISAEEMENHILAFSKIMNCAYVAMPDPVLGEKACVFAIPVQGQTFELNELNDFLVKERGVAKFKLPERLQIVTELPLSNVGKVSKVRLREMITHKLKEEGVI